MCPVPRARSRSVPLGSLAAALLSAVTATGCLAAGYAVPPVRVAVGAGTVIGDRPVPSGPPAPAPGAPAGATSTVPSVITTLEPLQLFPSLMSRPFEVGVGWSFEPAGTAAAPVHGFDFQLGWVLYAAGLRAAILPDPRPGHAALRPLRSPRECAPGAPCARLSARLRAGVLAIPGNAALGLRWAVQVSGEISGFARWSHGGGTSGGGDTAAFGGAGWGEGAVGLFADASQSALDGLTWWQLTAGVAVRLPTSAGGIAGVCGSCALAAGALRIR